MAEYDLIDESQLGDIIPDETNDQIIDEQFLGAVVPGDESDQSIPDHSNTEPPEKNKAKPGTGANPSSMQAYEPSLLEQAIDFISPQNRDAAAVEYAANKIAEKEGIPVSEVRESAGDLINLPDLSPRGEGAIQSFFEGYEQGNYAGNVARKKSEEKGANYDVPMLERVAKSVPYGVDNMLTSLDVSYYALAGGDSQKIAETIARNMAAGQDNLKNRTPGQYELEGALGSIDEGRGVGQWFGGTGNAINTFFGNPSDIPAISGEQAANSAPSAALGLLGAGAGYAVAGAPGAIATGKAGMAMGSVAVELGAEIQEMITDKLGVSPATVKNIQAILDAPGFMDKARARGLKKGLTIAAMDLLFLKVSGKIVGDKFDDKAAGLIDKIYAGTKGTSVEMLGEGLGEAASQYVARDGVVKSSDVVMEALASSGTSAVSAVVGGVAEMSSKRNDNPDDVLSGLKDKVVDDIYEGQTELDQLNLPAPTIVVTPEGAAATQANMQAAEEMGLRGEGQTMANQLGDPEAGLLSENSIDFETPDMSGIGDPANAIPAMGGKNWGGEQTATNIDEQGNVTSIKSPGNADLEFQDSLSTEDSAMLADLRGAIGAAKDMGDIEGAAVAQKELDDFVFLKYGDKTSTLTPIDVTFDNTIDYVPEDKNLDLDLVENSQDNSGKNKLENKELNKSEITGEKIAKLESLNNSISQVTDEGVKADLQRQADIIQQELKGEKPKLTQAERNKKQRTFDASQDDLEKLIRSMGGLNVNIETDYSGRLNPAQKKVFGFKSMEQTKGGVTLDDVLERANEEGFNFKDKADLEEALGKFEAGEPVYSTRRSDESMDLSAIQNDDARFGPGEKLSREDEFNNAEGKFLDQYEPIIEPEGYQPTNKQLLLEQSDRAMDHNPGQTAWVMAQNKSDAETKELLQDILDSPSNKPENQGEKSTVYLQPYDYRLKQYNQAADEESLTEKQRARFTPEDIRDTVTGMYLGTDRIPAMDRARKFSDDNNVEGSYADIDIRNLGGMNAKFTHTGANKHFKAFASIVAKHTKDLGATVAIRHGGDEMSIIAPAVSTEALQAGLSAAQKEIDQYVSDNNLTELPHAKYKGASSEAKELAKGTGIYFGVSMLDTSVKNSEIIKLAELQTEAQKPKELLDADKENDDVNKNEALAPGINRDGSEPSDSGTGGADQRGKSAGSEKSQENAGRAEVGSNEFPESKVVDSSGDLLVVYHGTDNEFDEFAMGGAQGWGEGVYFTDSKEATKDFGERTVSAYLNLKNPFYGNWGPVANELYETKTVKDENKKSLEKYGEEFDVDGALGEDGTFVGKVLRDLGFDGVMVEGSNSIEGFEIVVFDVDDIRIISNDVDGKKGSKTAEEISAEAAKAEGDTASEAQINAGESGNYKKGHISNIQGRNISIENEAGTKRNKMTPKEWPPLAHHYGDEPGTKGADGDALDYFIKKDVDVPADNPIFVINQNNKDGSFDETKTMLGFSDAADAEKGYRDSYSDDFTGFGSIVEATTEEYGDWVDNGDHSIPFGGDADSKSPATKPVAPKNDKPIAGMFAFTGEYKDIGAKEYAEYMDLPEFSELPDIVQNYILEAYNDFNKIITSAGYKTTAPSTILIQGNKAAATASESRSNLTGLTELLAKGFKRINKGQKSAAPAKVGGQLRQLADKIGKPLDYDIQDSLELKLNEIKGYHDQSGAGAKNVGKLINALGLQEKVYEGENFHIRIENSPYMDLVIEALPVENGKALYLTHYTEQNGDQMIDSEMVWDMSDGGALSLRETAVGAVFGESRGKDPLFANMFAKNLISQGFDKVDISDEFDLSQQTDADIIAAEKAEELRKKSETAAEKKKQADEDLTGFNLTGSDAAVDQAEAAGQENLFDEKPAEESVEYRKANLDFDDALGDLGDILIDKNTLKAVPIDSVKLLPVLTRLLGAAFRMGYYKFKDAAKFALDTIRAKFGNDAANAVKLNHLQAAYIGMSDQNEGAEGFADVGAVTDIAEINKHEAKQDESITAGNVERDSKSAGNNSPDNEGDVSDGLGADGGNTKRSGAKAEKGGSRGSGDSSVSNGGASSIRKPSSASVLTKTGELKLEPSPAGNTNGGRSIGSNESGVQPDRETGEKSKRTAEQNDDEFKQKIAEQIAASKKPVDSKDFGDIESIRDTLPLLKPEQQEDVLFIEKRFADNRGVMLTNGTGSGKRQPLTSAILTPSGWTTMGEIVPGSMVIGADGKATKVLNIYPVDSAEIFEVEFSDGAITHCCRDHLWETQTLYARRKASENPDWECSKPRVRSLSEIIETIDKDHYIPMVSPAELDPVSVEIHPYIMGVLLGDGCLVSGTIVFSNPDMEIIEKVKSLLPDDIALKSVKVSNGKCPTWRIGDKTVSPGKVGKWLDVLRKYKLIGAHSHEKFVPEEYMTGSIEQRTSLLQGLLDTDGTVCKTSSSPSFCSTSIALANAVTELVQSLGGTAKATTRLPKYTYKGEVKTGREAINVWINLPKEIKPFFLSRKADLYQPNKKYLPRRKITSIKSVGNEPAQCIKIDHPRHLYVTDDYILTHNTFGGMGLASRFIANGMGNILIVAPTQPILSGWTKEADLFGINVNTLSSKKDAGTEMTATENGLTATTYANFRDNPYLASREWDLIITDEVHHLTSGAEGNVTSALQTIRALTGHPNGVNRYTDMREHKLVDKIARLKVQMDSDKVAYEDNHSYREKYKKSYDSYYEAVKQLSEKRKKYKDSQSKKWNSNKPKTLLMSASPFSYEKSIELGDGYIFEYGEPDINAGYRDPSPRESFFIEHFGYSMANGKLTQPGAEVDRGLMQRQFNEWLKDTGALRGRMTEVDFDYSREFIGVDDYIGNKIDEAIDYINKESRSEGARGKGFDYLVYQLKDKFDYHTKMRMLEAIKARAIVPRVKQHIEMGRKVVLFHSLIKGDAAPHPFSFEDRPLLSEKGFKQSSVSPQKYEDYVEEVSETNKAIVEFNEKFKDLIDFDLGGMARPIDIMVEEFGDSLVLFNGKVSPKNKVANMNAFNDDNSNIKVMLAQDDAAREGLSLHDTTGVHQRVSINLGLPVKPTQVIQLEGRTYRTNQMSDAVFEYINTGTNFERFAFADKIANRSGAAENLALGNLARGLSESFIEKFENPTDSNPSTNQGVGDKEGDRRSGEDITPFEKAKTYYFGTAKTKGNRDQREGADYFATPEPIGFKMVEWAGISMGESVLEPSSGHGAIGRFFPQNTENTFIEPSAGLASRLSLRVKGDIKQVNFEDLNVINKYDVIIMNPPYGMGGATSTKHLEKAMSHLNDGGRIVALLPSGPAADKKIDKLLNGSENELEKMKNKVKLKTVKKVEYDQRKRQLTEFVVVADMTLPKVTFKRAGTQVSTHIVVIDRYKDMENAPDEIINTGFTEGRSINDLFDEMEGFSVPPRGAPVKAEAGNDLVEPESAFEAPQNSPGMKFSEGTRPGYSQIKFEGKPSAEIRQKLKDAKWKWSGKNKVWWGKTDAMPDFGGDGIFYSKSSHTPGANGRAAGITEAQAIDAIEQFEKELGNAAVIDIVTAPTKESIMNEESLAKLGNDQVKGYYTDRPEENGGGAIVLILSDLESVEDAISTLRHEWVVHHGLNTFSAEDKKKIITRIKSSKGEMSLRPMWEYIEENYSDKDADTQAEEVLAYMAENKATRLSKLWNDLVLMVEKFLRKAFGWKKGVVTKADLVRFIEDLTARVGAGAKQKTFDSAGNFSKQDNSNNENGDAFYSQMQSVLGKKLPGKGTPAQFKQQINNMAKKSDFKAEELEWSGVNEWLDSLDSGKITKQEVLDFLKANEIQIEEVIKSEMLIDPSKAGRTEVIASGVTQQQAESELSRDEDGNMYMVDNGDDTFDVLLDLDDPVQGDTKYGEHDLVLPGGENYKELLLTLPKKSGVNLKPGMKVDKMEDGSWNIFDQRAEDWVFKEGRASLDKLEKDAAMDGMLSTKDQDDYRSTHWDEANVLATVRYNERTDADGNKVLFLEEIQSDWHQQGRKEGYKGERKLADNLANKYDLPENRDDWTFGVLRSAGVTAEERMYWNREKSDTVSGLPNAPFKTTWPMLAMKRMIRHASENGFDSIAWTTGDQQNERYDLSKKVESIWYKKKRSGDNYFLQVFGFDGQKIISKQDLSINEIERQLGKEIAKKVENNEGEKDTTGFMALRGDNIKVGGEGMKGFYDNILPKSVNKYVKKWGVKVGETKITGEGSSEYSVVESKTEGFKWDILDIESGDIVDQLTANEDPSFFSGAKTDGTKVHSLKITDSMRSAAMQGQVLFSKKSNKGEIDSLISDEKRLSDEADAAFNSSNFDLAENIDAELADVRENIDSILSDNSESLEADFDAEYSLDDGIANTYKLMFVDSDSQMKPFLSDEDAIINMRDNIAESGKNFDDAMKLSDSDVMEIAKEAYEYKEKLKARRAGNSGGILFSKKKAMSDIDEKSPGAAETIKKGLKRWMTKEGLLPDSVFKSKVLSDSEKNVGESDISFYVMGLEAAVKKAYGKRYNKLSKGELDEINRYMSGERGVALPKGLHRELDVLRAYLDRLSGAMQVTMLEMLAIEAGKLGKKSADGFSKFLATNGADGYIPKSLQKHWNLYQTIEKNKGVYLNRSYQAFHDKKWINKVKMNGPLMKRARDFIAEQQPELTPEQVIGAVNGILEAAYDSGNFHSLLGGSSKLGAKDTSIITKKKEVPQVIRELLGEYKDPKLNFVNSATKMQLFIANHNFLMKVRKEGLGVFLFEVKTGDFAVQIAGDESETMNPLNGLYSNRDFVTGLKDATKGIEMSPAAREIIKYNSMVKYGKTILSPMTQARNFQSAANFAMLNGHLFVNPKQLFSSFKKAYSVTKSDLFTKDEVWRKYINKLIGLGVIHNNPNSGEMRDAMNDFMTMDTYTKGWMQTPKKIMDFFQKTYQLGDDFWKIIGYENELYMRLKTGMSQAEAEEQSAIMIRDGYPTYSMVPMGVKYLRMFPLVGTFVSFPYEVTRTSYNQFGFIKTDIKAGNKELAIKRIIGMALMLAGTSTLAYMSMLAMGIGDDDDEAVHLFLPPWMRNSQLFYTGYDENGMPTYYDMSQMDAYAYIKKPVLALLNGNNKGATEKIMDSMNEIMGPYFGIDIAAGALYEIMANKKSSGGRIYNPQDSEINITRAKLDYARKALQPGAFGSMERMILAMKGDRSRSGKQYTVSDETYALLGHRFGTLNIPQGLIYKSYEFIDNIRDASSLLKYVTGSASKISSSEVEAAAKRMLEARDKIYKDMIKITNAAKKLNVPENEIAWLMDSAGVSDSDIGSILNGLVGYWDLPKKYGQRGVTRAMLTAVDDERKREIKSEYKERMNSVVMILNEWDELAK